MRWILCAATVLAFMQAAPADDPESITHLKEMHLTTQLVADGAPTCVIAAPDTPEYLALAARLAAGIERTLGVAPPVVKAGEMTDEELAATNVISLGVFAFNAVTERLYKRELVQCDWTWPGGEDAFVIRTVHNPWLSGTNAVFLGGPGISGCRLAVDRFIELLGEAGGGAIGPIIEAHGEQVPAPLSEDEISSYATRLAGETSSRSMGALAARYCSAYFTSGDPGWARLFLLAMRRLDELTEAEGAADDMRACRYIFLGFDRVEEGPAFTDEERLELTNLFYRLARRLQYARATVNPSTTPHGNNWDAMAASWAALYFARYYPDLEIGRSLLEKMDTYYEPNMVNWRVNEDCPGYGNTTLIGNYEWALHRPDPRYIEGGGLRKMADLYMMMTNNLGQVCGYGDAGMIGKKYLVEAIPHAAWLYRDGRFLWFWDRMGGRRTRYWAPPEVLPRVRPDDLLGIRTMELAEWVYNRTNYEPERHFPIEQCFDKVTFRSGFEPDDQYLALGGFCYGFHSHPDANAILNYQDRGDVCLYDDGYMIPSLSEHNTVTVLRDGWAGHTPELARIIARADLGDVGLWRSRLAGYHGVDWDRCIIWPRGRYFLVVDELRAVEAGDYNFQCIWRTLGAADLDGRRWTSERNGRVFNLIACSDAALSQKESAGLSLNARPFPLTKARRLVQAAGMSAGIGDAYRFANVFYTTPAGDTRCVRAHRLGDSTTWLIDDDGTPAMAGINRSRSIAGLTVEAELFHLADDVLTAAG
ncbi:MAG: hypothetical protein J7M38_05755, partial [Armatimonadetes bacterium]|nr:hypothetical protein [Armatimonadota bacterium]